MEAEFRIQESGVRSQKVPGRTGASNLRARSVGLCRGLSGPKRLKGCEPHLPPAPVRPGSPPTSADIRVNPIQSRLIKVLFFMRHGFHELSRMGGMKSPKGQKHAGKCLRTSTIQVNPTKSNHFFILRETIMGWAFSPCSGWGRFLGRCPRLGWERAFGPVVGWKKQPITGINRQKQPT